MVVMLVREGMVYDLTSVAYLFMNLNLEEVLNEENPNLYSGRIFLWAGNEVGILTGVSGELQVVLLTMSEDICAWRSRGNLDRGRR